MFSNSLTTFSISSRSHCDVSLTISDSWGTATFQIFTIVIRVYFFWWNYINDFWLCVLYKKWSSAQRNRKKHSINQQAPTFLWYGQTTKSSSEQNKTTVLALSGSCGEKIGMCRVRGWGVSQSPRVLKSPPANTKLLWKHSVGGTELLFETADSRVDFLVCGGTVFPDTVYFPYTGILGFVWP